MKALINVSKIAVLILSILFYTGKVSAGVGDALEYLRGNLYVVQGNVSTLIDGNLTHYSDENSNAVDYNDAWKMTNPGENFGIIRSGVTLSVERRKRILFSDTAFFRMWNVRQQSYMVELVALNCNHPNLVAYLEDMYLKIKTPISTNGTTRVNFSVDGNAASAAQDRFRVIFRFNYPGTVPTRITKILLSLQQHNNRIADRMIEWNVENENYMDRYELQRSANGLDFEVVGVSSAVNLGGMQNYALNDVYIDGLLYYRLKGVSVTGEAIYSSIARTQSVIDKEEISIYPNPVPNKRVQLSISCSLAGEYKVLLFGSNGELRYKTGLHIQEGINLTGIDLPVSLPSGVYLMQLLKPDNTRITKIISVL